MTIKRRKTKTINIGAVKVGLGHPVSIQSMTKTDTEDPQATLKQIKALEQAGCEIIRVAVKNTNSALALGKIRPRINIPLMADIHFNYRLALEAVARGVDGLRLNPGNIYRREEVRAIALACKKRKIPIRVGVNSGSLKIENCKLKSVKLEDLMVKAALNYIKMLESFDFYDIIVSLKASSILETVAAYKKFSKRCRYPLHLGITAAGLPEQGTVKSAIGIGALLLEGIGDTVRVSLAGDPLKEVKVAREILQALDLRSFGPKLIVCPTCGRCQTDVVKIAREVKKKLDCELSTVNYQLSPKVAIMGCEVNGPGEAAEADLGIACGKNYALLFKQGKIIKKIKKSQIADALLKLTLKDRR
ncbi:MAG: flavodoxin-dependent (E)-4-hydroxy-3-methylbut-2-enyl-diphosphate synthase [Omnitrophica bacterium]|nr:flavodoxin-dependent (E)-4-hydroxy-3-methylbut-2-enyl-diphosphate synthase [Candidatus Omnitrophota bacterium]